MARPSAILVFVMLAAFITSARSSEEGGGESPLLANHSAPLWLPHRQLRGKSLADPIVDVLRVVYATALGKEALDAEEAKKHVDTDLERYARHYMFATLSLQLNKYGSIQNLTRVLEEDAELAQMEQQMKASTKNKQ